MKICGFSRKSLISLNSAISPPRPRNHQYSLRNIDGSEGAAGECALYGKIMKFHENIGFSRNSTESWGIAETRDFGKSIKRWKWSPGGPPIKPGLINNQCVVRSSFISRSNGFLVILRISAPPKMNKMYLFWGGSGGPKWTEIAKSQKCENAENEWKLRFWMKKCIFLVIFLEFHLFSWNVRTGAPPSRKPC